MKKQAPASANPGPSHTGCKESQNRCNATGQTGLPGNCMALADGTPIPTPGGWIPLCEIAPGQTVFDQAGRPCTVGAVCQREPEPVLSITFDDKSCLIAGAQQPWVTLSHGQRYRIHTGGLPLGNWAGNLAPPATGEIRGSLEHKRKTLVEAMHSVPLAKSLMLPDRELPIDPYLLGLWLGDGTSRDPTITCHRDDEPFYRGKAESAGEAWRIRSERGDVLSCSMAHGPHPLFFTRLRQLGVLGNKHVPPVYLRAGIDQRLELLRGLMDSDGCVGARDLV